MRLQTWAFIPRNFDEALARNSLCTMLDIVFEDLMSLLLACELDKYEKKREGYNNMHQVNSKKWESIIAKQQKPILYFMTHRPRDENNKQLSACHFVSNGNPSDRKPKPIYPSKNRNLDAPHTPAWVLGSATKHGEDTRQKVKEIAFEMKCFQLGGLSAVAFLAKPCSWAFWRRQIRHMDLTETSTSRE
jgi:hypothetical protein